MMKNIYSNSTSVTSEEEFILEDLGSSIYVCKIYIRYQKIKNINKYYHILNIYIYSFSFTKLP